MVCAENFSAYVLFTIFWYWMTISSKILQNYWNLLKSENIFPMSSAFEKNNASFINEGVVVTKFTGSHGKSGTSDASAEYVSFVKNLLEENGVLWQSGELGKVDGGGGGTVAMYIANLDVDVIDVGVPVLSMHAPYEIVAKIDVYMAYKAFTTFFTK